MTISFLSVLGNVSSHCLRETRQSLIKILLKDMAKKTLDCQLKLMALVTVYVTICTRGNFPIYSSKATGIDLQNLAVAGVTVVHIVKVL